MTLQEFGLPEYPCVLVSNFVFGIRGPLFLRRGGRLRLAEDAVAVRVAEEEERVRGAVELRARHNALTMNSELKK